MTQENKQLLLVDLCGRLPYGVKITDGLHITTLKVRIDTAPATLAQFIHGENLRYYLRPMSSMTEEEKNELVNLCTMGNVSVNTDWESFGINIIDTHPRFGDSFYTDYSAIDWLNKNMFDYRGLIQKGLAISTEEFNPYKD